MNKPLTGWTDANEHKRRFNRCSEELCPEMIFQHVFFQELDDRMAKSSPNLTKFYRHDHKELVNTSTEGIDELLHGLGEIDEILSKIGVFFITQKMSIGNS